MPKSDFFTTPINQADDEARRAFRQLIERYGADQIAQTLGARKRTIERIGHSRDVPPGMARELVSLIDASPQRDSAAQGVHETNWRNAFHAWAEDCQRRKEARNG